MVPARSKTQGWDRLLLVNAILGQFLSGFASRIFIVSVPTIAGALHVDIVGISWALIAYQLAGISLSVVFGRLGDLHGRYIIYGLGFAIMAVSSLLCGFAPNVVLLILFRFVQGIGAAMIASAARVLAMDAMPAGAEGRANGFMTMAFHGGFLIGPPLGGLVIDLLSWRWIFFLLVPMAVSGVVITALKARGRAAAPAGRPANIDYAGAAFLVVLTVTFTLVLDQRSAELLGAAPKAIATLAFAAAVLGFVVHERRASNPVVNLSLFKRRMFTFSVLSLLILATANSGLAFLLPFYMQGVLQFSASFMGLIFLVAPVFTIICAILSGQLTDQIGPRLPTSIGVVMTMAAFVVGLVLRTDSSWIEPALVMVPKEYRGFAAGMVQTVFGVGSLLGISLAGVLLTVLFRSRVGLADARPSAAADPLAFVSSMHAICLVCIGLSAVALAASLLRGRTMATRS
jgi:EmrB/QacA subfamily drug resistance transporter